MVVLLSSGIEYKIGITALALVECVYAGFIALRVQHSYILQSNGPPLLWLLFHQ